jgi:hypothetical protein
MLPRPLCLSPLVRENTRFVLSQPGYSDQGDQNSLIGEVQAGLRGSNPTCQWRDAARALSAKTNAIK